MPMDRFLIAPINSGLQTGLKPFAIPDDAFERCSNAYVFRERLRKRFGSRLMNQSALSSRARIPVTTVMSGAASGTVPGTVLPMGQMFSIGTNIYTVYQNGTMLITGGATTATFDTTSGDYSFTGLTATDGTLVYFYPATPIMALPFYLQSLVGQADITVAFDTQFAYTYVNGVGWTILGPIPPASGSGVWTGSDNQFHWVSTWQGATPDVRLLFVVNNNPPDAIQYYNGVTNTWVKITPIIDNAGNTLLTSLILIPFKNYLVALNTTEFVSGQNVTYSARARWSQFNNATITPDATTWRQDIPGRGNYLDASTMEDIVSCEFLKDRLIVYFDRSTWELVYIGNRLQPFTWQQINTELGAESSHGIVPFDKVVLGVSNVGIHACNGSNVIRVDDKIPDTVWQVSNTNAGVSRIYGIRDYYVEQVYWTFPNRDANVYSSTYPNQILVYNYKTGSWALNDDSFTAFGYFYLTADTTITWSSLDILWNNTEVLWTAQDEQPLAERILAGNQEGFIVLIDPDASFNAPALQITNIIATGNIITLTVINHNFNSANFIALTRLNGLTPVAPYTQFGPNYEIAAIPSSNTITIIAPDILASLQAGQVYTGGGGIARVSRIDVLSKQYNFYAKQGRNASINKVDFYVDKTIKPFGKAGGQITIDFFTSTSPFGLLEDSQQSGALMGNSILETVPYALYPYEFQQAQLWHPVYIQAEGQTIQIRLYFSDVQMLDTSITNVPFTLYQILFYAQPTSARFN